MSELIVIYDGQCDLCRRSITWVKKRLPIDAISYQDGDLASFGLTTFQCAKAVYVIDGQRQFKGADAVALLLKKRGNKVLAMLLTASGPLGRWGYLWVANHRSSLLVRTLTRLIRV
jgi:predicted DCC family thiol-disulfide oxidoreductase YuxK